MNIILTKEQTISRKSARVMFFTYVFYMYNSLIHFNQRFNTTDLSSQVDHRASLTQKC